MVWFDVHDGCSVDQIDTRHMDSSLIDLIDFCYTQPNRIEPMWRSCRKYAHFVAFELRRCNLALLVIIPTTLQILMEHENDPNIPESIQPVQTGTVNFISDC